MELKNGNVILDIKNFSFRFESREVLKNITLKIEKGDTLSILGPNGAGKSTLIKCLVRILEGGSGEITINGRAQSSLKQKDLARLMSYVPQADGRSQPYTVEEFVRMGRYPYLTPFSSLGIGDEQAVDRALTLTSLQDYADRHISALSGGERQRVFIAAALAQETEILLLDEPATFLDPKNQIEIFSILNRINKESGTTILSVTHDINSAAHWCKKVIALKEGEIVFSGKIEEAFNTDVLRKIYDTSFQLIKNTKTGQPIALLDS